MPFQPEEISRENILTAIAEFDGYAKKSQPSRKFDLIFGGKTYPPKELLRRAHEIAVGEYLWDYKGGPDTNNFLIERGFEVVNKADSSSPFFILIRDYKELINKQGLKDEIYKWQLLEKFKGRPDPAKGDFLAELKSITFSNLIYGPGIGVMYHLARQRTDAYRHFFMELYDESIDLGSRIRDFSQKIGHLYREIDTNPTHMPHHDERTIATILTYHDPYRYTFYKDSFYRILCRVIGEVQAEPGRKYEHYLQIVRDFIDEYIKDDDELIASVNSLKPADAFGDPNYMVLAQDILYRMLEINKRTFQSVMDEVAVTLADDPEKHNLSVMMGTFGKNGKREWVWIGDSSGLIGSEIAHYEVEVVPNHLDKINVCLHFEDEETKSLFRQHIGNRLPDVLEWFRWFKSHSVRLKQPIDFYGEQTVPELIAALKSFDKALGGQVRLIVQELNTKIKAKEIQMKQPLNQILYGPPGTGKTYHTIDKALQVLGEPTQSMTRSEMKALFEKYREDQRIVFTTFHQSLSYEDFIEGIKPIEPLSENSPVQYETKPGVFKKICNAAKAPQDVKAQPKDIFTKARFFKMSLGGLQNPHIHDWCIKNNCIGLGWGGDKNFSDFKGVTNWTQYRDKFNKAYPDLVEYSRYNITAMYTFQNMKIGDIVVISKGNHVIDAIGKIISDYYWSDDNDFDYYQFRKVEWLAVNLNQTPSTFFNKQISQQSIYGFFDEDVKKQVFIDLFKSGDVELKPYVLIIDEINRGNVSKIFGELITLLEPDKRLGNAEALQAVLPYSREVFGVPSNLFIIGTMNTADRSVEALDTALRRRFSFEEMQPMPELLSPPYQLWRMLWCYHEQGWDNPEYQNAERALFKMIEPDETLKLKLQGIWDGFNERQQEDQVDEFDGFSFGNINLQKLLTTINLRLEVLKDRDHQIGHAYLINVYSISDLIGRFKDSIIPLLQEYFFGDYNKLLLILGPGFIIKEEIQASFAVDDEDNYQDKLIFRISQAALSDESAFLNAYKLMKV